MGSLLFARRILTQIARASVGRMSLALGFPADAVSHRLTIREARRSRPATALPGELLDRARVLLGRYYRALDGKELDAGLPDWSGELLEFVRRHRAALACASDVAGQVLLEDVRDVLGLFSGAPGVDRRTAARIRRAALGLSGLSESSIDDDGFEAFLHSRREALERAVRGRANVIFAIGHENPDTDAIVSAIAEAYRQHLMDRTGETTFVPVVAGNRVPEEVVTLLGRPLARSLVRSAERLYRRAARSGRPEWIFVDHSIGPEQPDVRAIVDHHHPAAVALRQRIPRRILFAGSTTALVALRIYGLGLEVPPRMARVLLGAALMDTEDRFPGKTTALDGRVMDRLRTASGVPSEPALYRGLMRDLVSCYDADRLFVRDYKEDWTFFGFAVAKAIRLLDPERGPIVRRLLALARSNNEAKNLPLTLVKVVDYAEDAETIRREVLHLVFRPGASEAFRRAVRETVRTVIRHESGPGLRLEESPEAIAYWGVGTQLSRKKLAPVLELVAGAFHRYFRSPSTGLWLRRDFLRRDERLEAFARRRGLALHADEEGVVVGNPAELKYLLQGLGWLCASPSEYFRALADARAANDRAMVAHLTSSRYLETLDAIVEDRTVLVAHPTIRRRRGRYSYEGRRRRVRIPPGEPGLIDPAKVDPSTGLPTEVEDPRQYGTSLWRYWSPDRDRAWVLRSTILAYDMPALDLKFGFDEALPRLTIRPCLRRVRPPRVRVRAVGTAVRVEIDER